MSSRRITVRVPRKLGSLLENRSRLAGTTPSDLVRIALETYLSNDNGQHSAYEIAEEAGLIGCVQRAPKDLSTNLHHFHGFGKKRQ
jgi:metal-responsive CopG/Arc/MetJ family transcriptional regulator